MGWETHFAVQLPASWNGGGAIQRRAFPRECPLLPHQEEVLQWIKGEGKKTVPPFASRRGSWRPDFLFNAPETISVSVSKNPSIENPQICEINARFMFNAFFGAAFTHEAFQRTDFESFGLKSPVDPSKVFAAFKGMFDINSPIHLLKSSEIGIDIHLLEYYLRERCGLKVQFIKPEQLRLVPNTSWGSNSTLWCAILTDKGSSEDKEDSTEWRLISPEGEILEQVHQVALELHQSEMESLGQDMLKDLAPLCVNNLRTIYLVHDKRMLADEAEMLQNGIAQTILAGSSELKELIQCTRNGVGVKDNFVLKLIGSSKGNGIIFGEDISTEVWMEYLVQLSEPQVTGSNYVIQRVARQPKFDVTVPSKSGKPITEHYYLVGTFMMVDGKPLGIAGWRSGPGRICAVSHGGSWICNLVRDSNVAPTLTMGSEVPCITAYNLNDTQNVSHVNVIDDALQNHGIMAITLTFPDAESTCLLKVVQSLQRHHAHGEPLTHSSTQDIKADNIFHHIEDTSILAAFEEAEISEPSPRKRVADREIYVSRPLDMPKSIGEPVLSDFRNTVYGTEINDADVYPTVYRCPEVMLHLPWSYSADIWNVGAMIWDIFEGKHLFNSHDSKRDRYTTRTHLTEMISILGPPPLKLIKRGKRSAEWFDENGNWLEPDESDPERLPLLPPSSLEAVEENLEGKNKELFLNFIRSMLQWEPEKRRTARELLSDPWLSRKNAVYSYS
ncbi:hypothetical protein VE02_09881 [Pseudogymnoascus sp. 03VT05]|nr:hypothetical protein VE02_09881 [Pseudogymnoascus sp. 03VT05]